MALQGRCTSEYQYTWPKYKIHLTHNSMSFKGDLRYIHNYFFGNRQIPLAYKNTILTLPQALFNNLWIL